MSRNISIPQDHYDDVWRLITRYEIMLRHKGYSRSDLDEIRLRVFSAKLYQKYSTQAKPGLNRRNKAR